MGRKEEVRAEISSLSRKIKRLEGELGRLEKLLDGEEMEEGTVLAVAVKGSLGRTYRYVALKADDLWYFTGNGPHRATWAEVSEWLSKDGRKVLGIREIAKLTVYYPNGVRLTSSLAPSDSFRWPANRVTLGDLGLGGDYR